MAAAAPGSRRRSRPPRRGVRGPCRRSSPAGYAAGLAPRPRRPPTGPRSAVTQSRRRPAPPTGGHPAVLGRPPAPCSAGRPQRTPAARRTRATLLSAHLDRVDGAGMDDVRPRARPRSPAPGHRARSCRERSSVLVARPHLRRPLPDHADARATADSRRLGVVDDQPRAGADRRLRGRRRQHGVAGRGSARPGGRRPAHRAERSGRRGGRQEGSPSTTSRRTALPASRCTPR